jgi:hypothetical protein
MLPNSTAADAGRRAAELFRLGGNDEAMLWLGTTVQHSTSVSMNELETVLKEPVDNR